MQRAWASESPSLSLSFSFTSHKLYDLGSLLALSKLSSSPKTRTTNTGVVTRAQSNADR